MEILVTIIAFWLILVGVYGAYSLTQERSRERTPRVREQRPAKLQTASAGAGPFGPVSLPAERVPGFINRRTAPATAIEDLDEELAREERESDRFAAERIVAARLQARIEAEEGADEPGYESEPEPVYEVPKPSMPRYVDPDEEPVRPAAREEGRRNYKAPDAASDLPRFGTNWREASRPAGRSEAPRTERARAFELPQRPRPTEVDVLRAQVQDLRSEIFAMSSEPPRRSDRPKQRRYRTGNYTHLPRKLTRQMNEARGRLPNE